MKHLYHKTIKGLDLTVEFRLLDPDLDLNLFHQWHHSPRVAFFWELQKTHAELKTYIQEKLASFKDDPLLVLFNGEPAGYLETYWAYHDRIKPYYDAREFDRGFHFLIGETQKLGSKTTAAFLTCVCDYLFQANQKTTRIVAEPRVDNKLLLRYLQKFPSWRKEKEFDFPHKRAALLICERELFYTIEENYDLLK